MRTSPSDMHLAPRLGLAGHPGARADSGAAQPPRAPTPSSSIEVQAQPIEAFDPREPTRTRFGALEFRGGLVLTSPIASSAASRRCASRPTAQHFLAVTDKGHWLRGRIVYRGRRADRHRRCRDGADARARRQAARAARLVRRRIARRGRRHALCRHRARQPDRALRLSARTACARAASRSRCRRHQALPNNKGLECLVSCRASRPLAGTLIAISERGLDAAGNLLGFLIGGRERRAAVHGQAQRRFRRQRLRALTAGRRSAGARAALLVDARRRHAHPPHRARRASSPARWSTARADLRRHGLSDRQHGRPGGAPRRRRRDRADAGLRRQFLGAAAHAAAAVHAGGVRHRESRISDDERHWMRMPASRA